MNNCKSKTTRKILIAIVVLLTFYSCARQDIELKNVVTAYIKMLPEALGKPDEGVMEYFTTNNELSRIGAYIMRLKAERKILVSELIELQFIDTNLSDDPNAALVQTRERWTFYYADFKTREKVTDEEFIEYENTYNLVKQDNHWVVDRIDVKEK